jgi:hypothetical protein
VLGEVVRPQILCREADLNFDGRKDVFRVFAEGTALYEDQDWDFDGVLDARVRFAGGVPISMAFGAGLDGDHPQMIVLLQAGQLRRVKRHVVGDENYDIHELFQVMYGDTDPSLFSIGVDFDGDGFMDRQVIPQDVVPDEPVEDEGAAEEAGGEEEGS